MEEPQMIHYYSRSFSKNGDEAVEEFLKFLEDHYQGKFIVNLCGRPGDTCYYSILQRRGSKTLKQILIIENHNGGCAKKGLLTYPRDEKSILDIHRIQLNWPDVFGPKTKKGKYRRLFDYRGKKYSELKKIMNHFLIT